jgi:cysteine sulfinate desulfinase/cysteine desulfurase-like protein
VLTAMNLKPEVIDGAFRVSLSRETTHEELDVLYASLKDKVLPYRLKGRGGK